MSIYEVLINEVIERLVGTEGTPANLALFGLKAEKLTQHKGKYKVLPTDQVARAMVGFPMHNYGTEKEPTNLLVNAPDQESDLYISVVVSSRTLFDDNNDGKSLLDFVEKTQRLLLGFSSSWGGGELSVASANLLELDSDNNVWHYMALFRVQRFILTPIDNYRIEPPIAEGTLQTLEVDEFVDEGIFVMDGDNAIDVGEEGDVGDQLLAPH